MTETLPSISRSSQTQSSRQSSEYRSHAREALCRPSTLGSNESRAGEMRPECLTSLSALYRSSYKPYQFTHMYGTNYNKNFQGSFGRPPPLERLTTARYASINYSSLKTTYQQEFQDKEPMGKSLILPCSRHRKNKPHPHLANTWKYPNSFRWIWEGNTPRQKSLGTVYEEQNRRRKTKSAEFFAGKTENIRTHRWCSR